MLVPTLVLVLAPALPVAPAQGPTPKNATRLACLQTVEDAASGDCVHVSSQPTLGMLLPLGPELFVDSFGRVGIGTLAPATTLDVAGVVRSRAGGFEFPDGSLQSTATLVGPQGPPGPAGPLEPPLPATSLGTVSFTGSINCDATSLAVYELSLELDGGNLGQLVFSKEVDACTPELFDAWSPPATNFPSVDFTLGDLGLQLEDASILEICVRAAPDTGSGSLPPRAELTLTYQKIHWIWTGPQANSTSWDRFTFTGTGADLGGASLLFALPDQDALTSGVELFDGALTTVGLGEVELVKPPDSFTPRGWLTALKNLSLGDSELELRTYSSAMLRDVAAFGAELGTPRILGLRFELDPSWGLSEVWRLDYTGLQITHEKP